jgi:hypothetical protein
MQPEFLPLSLWAIIILRAGPGRVWLKVANVGLLDKFGLGFIFLLDSIGSLSLSLSLSLRVRFNQFSYG